MQRPHLTPPPNLSQDTIDIFMSACDTGEIAMLRHKISTHPGIVNLKDDDGISALHHAVSWAQTETVELLLEKGADPSIKDTQGQTPDILAARLGYEPIAKIIVQAGHRLQREEDDTIRRLSEAESLLRKQRDEMTKGLKRFKEGLDAPVKAKPVARFRWHR